MARHVTYVEEFSTDASVLMFKRPSSLEVLNGLGEEVGVFSSVLRDRTQDLIAAIRLTPYSRLEFERAWQPADEPVERARRLYVRSWQSHSASAITAARPARWRHDRASRRPGDVISDRNNVDYLWAVAARLKQAHIEADDWRSVFSRYDSDQTLHFVHPPVGPSRGAGSRGGRKGAPGLGPDEVAEIFEVIRSARGMVMFYSNTPRVCAGSLDERCSWVLPE
jgi:DNA adenine methylase